MTLLALLLLPSGVLMLWAARSERTNDVILAPRWQPDIWYPLEDHDSTAICELPAGARYRLVIGCLSNAENESSVRLRLTSTAAFGHHRTVEPAGVSPRTASSQTVQELTPTGSPSNPSHRPPPHHRTETSAPPLGTAREVFLHVTDGDLDDPKQYARITTRNVACGDRVRVFLDQQLADGEVPRTRIEELVRMLEADVVPRIESQFGPLQDVDHDGRFAVVLTPWLSRLQGGRTSIGGMVRSSDFRSDVAAPLGNHGDMLFLNSALPGEAALRDLLSHEVAHAACISQRLPSRNGIMSEEEDWLSESLAHLAEPGWSNLDHRLVAFLDDPSRYPLVVPDYYRAGLWRNPGCRGATALFTRWCVERHGPEFVRRLVESRKSGTDNLECATGQRFADLFRGWSISLATGQGLAKVQPALDRLGSEGLRPIVVNGNHNREQTLRVRGTAFTVVELPAASSERRTLRIVGDTSARWQFSICRLSEDMRSGDEIPLLANAHGTETAR